MISGEMETSFAAVKSECIVFEYMDMDWCDFDSID
jgi:hypothetical protein